MLSLSRACKADATRHLRAVLFGFECANVCHICCERCGTGLIVVIHPESWSRLPHLQLLARLEHHQLQVLHEFLHSLGMGSFPMSSECIGLKLITTQQQQQPSRDRIVPIFRAGSRTTPWTSPMLCGCSPAKGRCAARQRCPERCWFGPKRNVQFPVSPLLRHQQHVRFRLLLHSRSKRRLRRTLFRLRS